MDIWLQFDFYYYETTKRLEVSLREFTKTTDAKMPYGRRVGSRNINVPDRALKNPTKISNRIAKAKAAMIRDYHKDRKVKDQLLEACDEWSKEKITVQDGQLDKIIKELNKS